MNKNRWSESELQIIKDVFKDEGFVYAVRDVFMGLIDTFEHKTTDTVISILRKNLLPSFQADVPLEMQQDLCLLSLDFITGFNAEQGVLRIEAFDIGKDYLERRFKVLEGEEDNGDSLEDLKTKAKDRDDRFIRMLAYLQLGKYIEKSLKELVEIANHKELTKEEIIEKNRMDSAR